MSRECTDSEVSNHQVLSPHEENNSNRMLGKTTSRSKVYPLEGFTHSEIRNDQVNEKVMVVEVEGSPNELAAPKQQKSLCRRNLTEAIVVTVTIITTALAFISFARYYLSPYSRSEFIYVNMIWRHGDRAPVYHFPNFTEKYMIAFPRGLGNLTKIGREQAEQLGLLIKDRYIHPYDITSEQIYVRSTDVFRTIETARHVLQGMSFPEIKVNASLKTSVDTAGNPFFDCPVANQFVQDRKEKYLMRENFTEIYELVLQKLNYSNDLYRVFDTLLCLQAHDLVIPDWLDNQDLHEKLKLLSWRGVEAHFGMGLFSNELQRKIRGGSILRGIVSRIACKVNYTKWMGDDSCDEKFYGLSAHDMTIASLLSTFSDISSILGDVPLIGFAANIAFEIRRIDDLYEMKVFYANQWNEKPKDITRFAPGCENSTKFCDVIKFIERSTLLFFDNVHEECAKGVENSTSHIFRRSVGPENTDEIDLIQMY